MTTSSIEIDECGNIILKITLSTKKFLSKDRQFRFMLDTGCSTTIISKSVPDQLFWNEGLLINDNESQKNGLVGGELVIIKRMIVGGMVRDEVAAIRMDIENNSYGQMQDVPVDGILGMNVLRGLKFTIRPAEQRIEWWNAIVGASLPLEYDPLGLPIVSVSNNDQTVACIIDTGYTGGIELPTSFLSNQETKPIHKQSFLGVSSGVQSTMGFLSLGGQRINNIPCDFFETNSTTTIGLKILMLLPFSLDFLSNRMILGPELMNIQFDSIERKQMLLPLRWNRLSNSFYLSFLPISNDSEFSKAGIKEGDKVLRVGPLIGQKLTKRGILNYSLTHNKLQWELQRGNEKIKILTSGQVK